MDMGTLAAFVCFVVLGAMIAKSLRFVFWTVLNTFGILFWAFIAFVIYTLATG